MSQGATEEKKETSDHLPSDKTPCGRCDPSIMDNDDDDDEDDEDDDRAVARTTTTWTYFQKYLNYKSLFSSIGTLLGTSYTTESKRESESSSPPKSQLQLPWSSGEF